ncbi:MAG: DUF3808 domain-containing protein, partial [Akkermansiaceae bacterium]|nr:DUF3808 domain-containing protein [Akkermansiaceae bacterium]
MLPEGEFLIELSEEVKDAVKEALALGKRGETEAAREILARVEKDHPHNHQICFAKGTLLVMEEEYEQAIKWFDQAIEIYPCMVEAHHNKAAASMELMDVANCVRSFRKVVQFGDRDDPDVMQA